MKILKIGNPKCFNCNKYKYMAKKCQSKKKKREMRKYFKYDEEEHIAKNCKRKLPIKNYKVQEELDNKNNDGKNNDKKQNFKNNLK